MNLNYRDPRLAIGLAFVALVCLVAALYLPFADNPLFFDDRSFFSGRRFADYASSPFAIELRRPAYFSIVFTHILSGDIEVHRSVSIAFHAGCALALFWALLALRVSRGPAFVAAVFFALHPVATYAAGYLVQRTILLATLFSLLSLALFVQGLKRERYAAALAAAAAYWVAVLSKEHSILLPAAVLLAVPLVAVNWRFARRYAALYAAGCAPAAILVFLMSISLLGRAYEPALGIVAPQVEAAAASHPGGSAWLASVLAQAGFFFRYVAVWLWPNVSGMAIDMPIDVRAAWSPLRAVASISAFALTGVTALLLLLRARGWLALLGYGILFAWIPFFVEFSSIRFQEPFVLYRSYLWAPGLAIAAAAVLGRMPPLATAAAGAAVAAFLFIGAVDRLQTFSSPLLLWEDAAAKLPSHPVPGGARTLFNLAREQFYAGEIDKAAFTADACIARHPDAFYCHFGRGSQRLQQGQYADALRDIDRALELQRNSGMAHHHRGVALEGLGRLPEARTEYELARKFRFRAATYRLHLLDERERTSAATPGPPSR